MMMFDVYNYYDTNGKNFLASNYTIFKQQILVILAIVVVFVDVFCRFDQNNNGIVVFEKVKQKKGWRVFIAKGW